MTLCACREHIAATARTGASSTQATKLRRGFSPAKNSVRSRNDVRSKRQDDNGGSDRGRRSASHTQQEKSGGWTHFQAVFHQGRRLALRRDRVGTPPRPDHRRQGRRDLRAEGRRDSQRLVDDRDQHRGQQVSAWHAGHSRARDRRPPARDPRGRDHSRLGHQGRILPHRRRRRHLPRRTGAPAAAAEGGVQLAGVVQRGMRPHRAQLRRAELALERGRAEGRIQRGRLHASRSARPASSTRCTIRWTAS